MRAITTAAALVAFAIPTTVIGAIALDQAAGSLEGMGITPTHDFPVKATQFDITISDPDAEGFRSVEVSVPVEAIDTNNGGRDSHMRGTIFDGYKEAGKANVVFEARTDSELTAGPITLDGRLSIVGQARPVTVTATISGTDPLRAQGKATIDLEEWGIKTPGFGPMKVDPTVTMGFDVELPAPSGTAEVSLAD
jgi:polyisoprenoid-binding protein YceI